MDICGWLSVSIDVLQCFTVLFAHFLTKSVYNVWFHPLRNFPGPIFAAATPLPYVWHLVFGTLPPWNIKLHAWFGEVVRISPDELSFIGAPAWRDIYIARPGLPKPTFGQIESPNGVYTMATVPDLESHQRQRKIVSHAFSERALKEQEYIIQRYATLSHSLRHEIMQYGTGVKWNQSA